MSQCKTQADCFRELARVAAMCEGTKVKYKDCIKFGGKVSNCPAEDIEQGFYLMCEVTAAVAIVEDRPVFISEPEIPDGYPVTVMVELTREDAEFYATESLRVRDSVAEACRKALEKTK